MPWVRAALRGQIIYARANSAGELALEGAKVEIRYKPRDGRRYDALAKNLSVVEGPVLPDDTCGEAERPPEKEKAKDKPAAKRTARAKGAKAASAEGGAGAEDGDPQSVGRRGARPGELQAYTDGACTGNPGPAGLGVVLVDSNGRTELSEFLGAGTNNIAELAAIERALDMTEDRSEPLRIHTDSQYAIGVLTKGWKAKANRELIEGIREKLEARSGIVIVYVPGHAGVPLNERADELARTAIKTRATRSEAFPLRSVVGFSG